MKCFQGMTSLIHSEIPRHDIPDSLQYIRTYLAIECDMMKGAKLEERLTITMGAASFS